ncbi:MAG: LemA family protein [Dehalococcoidia bacterium]|nr:LemA family protein [Dehalococcoidia bacterium]
MDAGLIVVIVLLGIVLIGLAWLVLTYNGLIGKRNRAEAAWSQVDVQLKRRYDLIPNLVETVKGYAAHERETLDAVVRARQQAIDTSGVQDQAQAENMLTQALRQVFALAEAYPDLKANQNFLQLQEELTATESRIAFSRQFYNEQVLTYDNALEMFPSSVVGGMFNFEARAYFEMDEGEREPVQVSFT